MGRKNDLRLSSQQVSLFDLYRTVARTQAKYLRNFLLSGSFTTPPLVSVTLDKDDVKVARGYLKKDRSDWYDPEMVQLYEQEFAQWNGSQFAFAYMGGRVALSACIYALGLKPGDEVIVPGYTCVVVPNAFQFAGVKIVYSDIELETYGLDASKIADHITPRTRAILIHHLYGLVCRDYGDILDLAKKHDLKVIEDCSHGTGALFRGQRVGTYGDCAFYSSEQSKVFSTIQGGMAVTDQPKIAEKMAEFYVQAQYPSYELILAQLHNVIINYYQHKHPHRWYMGMFYNLRYGGKQLISTTREEERGIRPDYYGQKMPAPIAAIGLNQIKKIDSYNQRRRDSAKRWDRWCQEYGYQKAVVIPDSSPIYLRYPVMVEPEKKINKTWAIKDLGVEIGVWFVSQMHPTDRPVMGCPNGEKASHQCINFPC